MPRTHATRPERLKTAWALACIGGVAVGCVVWAGCSVEKHYKTLSFFFDGVPDPEARARAIASGKAIPNIRESPTYSVHKPYKEEKCDECHTAKFVAGGLDSSICLKCHQGVPSEHSRMHGPVAAAACLWCHAPHESAEAALLKRPARQVCAQCHDQSMLSTERVPAHADNARGCLECHAGHGGKAAYFLREGVSRVAPAPTIAPQPAAPVEPGAASR